MTDVAKLLGDTKTVLLIDWPSRDVPDTLARSHFTVVSNDGDELPEIVDTAKAVGAKAVWIQTGRDKAGAKDLRGCWLPEAASSKARGIVEAAGLIYIEAPYIADAARALRP